MRMWKDSELFLKKLLVYRNVVGKDEFEVNFKFFEEMPGIRANIYDIINELIYNNCITNQSKINDLKENISINLTMSGITYFDKEKLIDDRANIIFNITSRQVNVADRNSIINAQIRNNEKNLIINKRSNKRLKNRTYEYAKKWNENMFLNDFNERDGMNGTNIQLKDVYLESHLSHYLWKNNDKIWSDLKHLLSEYIGENTGRKMLLVLGQPGIGKSTLITWITSNFIDCADKILVYQFASDLKNVNWQYEQPYERKKNNKIKDVDIVDRVLNALGLTIEDLEGNILILDGFDEIYVESDRAKILNQLYWKLIKESLLNNFSLIITCRENYFKEWYIECDYIKLLPWDEEQIKSFCSIYKKMSDINISINTVNSILDNENVFGIPLILYMVLALNIAIEKEGSIAYIYNCIFSLEGGIYDRCIKNDRYASPHRISKIKEEIHLISENIAFWIFVNNSSEAYISQTEYNNICNIVVQKESNDEIKQDFLIGNYFKMVRHCEGVDKAKLYFIHRSIYEFFVSEYIYVSLCKVINISKESLAGALAVLLEKQCISKEILDFFKYKIQNGELIKNFNEIKEAFELMLENGMLCFTNERYNNVIDCEMMVFGNMLEIIHLWEIQKLKFGSKLFKYIRYNTDQRLNLENINLSGADLNRANLFKANLQGADLSNTDLTNANLEDANLTSANLSNADLRAADLNRADFSRTNLNKTLVDHRQASYLQKKYSMDLIGNIKVYLYETEDVLEYSEWNRLVRKKYNNSHRNDSASINLCI